MYKTFMFLASNVVALTLVGSVATGGIVFLDNFEDGSITDGAPVTWSPVPGATGSFEVIDGDYVLTRPSNSEEMYTVVSQYTFADTSARTQARLIGSNAWWFGLFARVNLTPQTAYIALLKNNGNLEIWLFGPSSAMLASAYVAIDPRVQDVRLRFDVIGNKLSAWAWREGDSMPTDPQVTTVHSGLRSGFFGLAGDLGNRLSDSQAIFRYVEAYEPIPPSPDLNGDGVVDCADLCVIVDHWLTSEPSCDLAPPPFGDGIVDVQDLIALAEHLFEEIFPPELVAYWKLDETEGSVAHDTVADNHGMVYDQPLWQPAGGNKGGALELDGIDDYISADFVLNPWDGAFSAFAWIQGGAPGDVVISQTDGIGGSGETWLGNEPISGKLMTGLVPPLLGRFIPKPLVSKSVITDGQWHHIGFVWDGSYRSLYVDGSEVAKDASSQASLKSATGGLYIGADKTLGASAFFSGLIDDVRIYNKALSTEEIAALAQ